MSYISKYFSKKELDCNHCGEEKTTDKLKQTLDKIRSIYGKPISLTNAYRCPIHNKNIGGAPRSKHMEGNAADMARTEELLKHIQGRLEFYDIWLEDPRFTSTWIHVQVVPYPGWKKGMSRTFQP